MIRVRSAAILACAATLLGLATGCAREESPAREQALAVPLYDDLGDHHYAVTTGAPAVQAYFDQGLRLYYAFNHAEAIRSFRAAQALDDQCAMCWWGEALAWGPNINLPMDSASAVAAFAASEHARSLRGHASPVERALIDALALRYAAVPPAERSALDEAYAVAMGAVATSFPDDVEVSVLHGESLMDLRPWDYWTDDGTPKPGIAEALAEFEGVLATQPDHPGACHFFIHAVEKLYPERAVSCAERLASLMPGAGHIVHMPGHIYVRVGRYQDAIEANEHAVHADETYIRDQNPAMGMYTAGYYPHNYDFLSFAASMIGRSAMAIEAADKMVSLIPEEMYDAPGMDLLHHWESVPWQMRVRFGHWDELLTAPAPPESRLHSLAMWHYAQGRALAASGDVPGARQQLAALREIASAPSLEGVRMEYNLSTDLLGIAGHVLAGWIADAAGDYRTAIGELRRAVRIEDSLRYGEPPEWAVPTRQDLGAVLLHAGRAVEAETVFRAALKQFPDNGWSLWGLAEALRDQGRESEADTVDADFQRVWATADVQPRGE